MDKKQTEIIKPDRTQYYARYYQANKEKKKATSKKRYRNKVCSKYSTEQ